MPDLVSNPEETSPDPADDSRWAWWAWLRLVGWVAITAVFAAGAALGITIGASASSGAQATAAVAQEGRLWLLAALGLLVAPWAMAAWQSSHRRRLLLAALIATSPLIWTMYQAIDRHWWDGNWLI